MALPIQVRIKQKLKKQRNKGMSPRELMKQLKIKRSDYRYFEAAVQELVNGGEEK